MMHPQYEKIYQTDKSKAMVMAQKEEQRRLREEKEKEIRERDEARSRKLEEQRRNERLERLKQEEANHSIQRVRDKLGEDFMRKREEAARKAHEAKKRTADRDTANFEKKRSRSSTSDPREKENVKKRDPKLDMKTEVLIPRDEMRRAYKAFMERSRETSETDTCGGLGDLQNTINQLSSAIDDIKEKPTEEDAEIATARAVLNAEAALDDDTDNFPHVVQLESIRERSDDIVT